MHILVNFICFSSFIFRLALFSLILVNFVFNFQKKKKSFIFTLASFSPESMVDEAVENDETE